MDFPSMSPRALLLSFLAFALVVAVGCSRSENPSMTLESGDRVETVRAGELPSFARSGGSKVQEAYRFAAANSDILRYIPCYCGCVKIGHKSNEDCYITGRHPDGTITFTSHAAT